MDGDVLVLGGTGKTARRLVPLLRERGVRARPASRHPQGDGAVRFDWDDRATWDPALEGADRVYLVPPALDPAPDRQMIPFLERAAAAGVRRAVLLSALGVEQGPEVGQRAVELALPGSIPDSVILRPTWFMENLSEGLFAPPIVAADTIALPGGEAPYALVAAGDIAAVAAAALTEDGHAGAAYPITGPEALTHAEVAEQVGAARGRPVRYVDADPDDFRAQLEAGGVHPGYVALLTRLFEAGRAGAASAVHGTVERVTGRPATSFAEFAKEAAPAWAART
jgi:uncharacterized protein YbjT (DUF2867 family)